jgi:hypothetical protein
MSRLTDWQAILRIADRLEPEARARFIAAVVRFRSQTDIAALVQAITKGSAMPTQFLLDMAAFRAALEPLLDVHQRAFMAGGQDAARQIGDMVASIRFDITNPLAVAYAQQTAILLSTRVTMETELAIRNVITRAFTEGLTRREASALIRPMIGLTDGQATAVMNYRTGLLESGLARDRVETLVDRYAAKQLRLRAANIARTEIMGASNHGQQALWQQAIDKKLLDPGVDRKWTTTPDERRCKFCQSMAGQLRKMNQPFTCPLNGKSVLVPPLHCSCRCVVVLSIKAYRRAA